MINAFPKMCAVLLSLLWWPHVEFTFEISKNKKHINNISEPPSDLLTNHRSPYKISFNLNKGVKVEITSTQFNAVSYTLASRAAVPNPLSAVVGGSADKYETHMWCDETRSNTRSKQYSQTYLQLND